MKILMFASWYPDKEKIGRGIFFKEQAEMLSEMGHEISVIVAERKPFTYLLKMKDIYKSIFCKHSSIEVENGITVYRSNKYKLFPLKIFPALIIPFLIYDSKRMFNRYLAKNGKPDIIHAQSAIHGGFIASRITDKYQIPLVITEHRSNYFNKKIPLIYKIETIICSKKVYKYIFVSESLKQAVKNMVGKNNHFKNVVIGNYVHDIFFNVPIKESNTNVFVFCTVGNLIKIKDHKSLIISFFLAFKNIKNVHLLIVGEGKERQSLEKLIFELKIKDKVTFLGYKTRIELVEILSLSNSFVFSSKNETFGLALAEATAVGLPVISTNCGGPSGIISNKNGYLVPVGDRDLFAKKMFELYINYKKFNRLEIRKECQKKYGRLSIGTQIENVYKECLGINIPKEGEV